MPITTSVTLSLTYDEIRCLQVAVQKMNADMPSHAGLAALTPKIANIAYPSTEVSTEVPSAPTGAPSKPGS